MPKEKEKPSPKEALLKAANYCVYQERCHNEVRNKLAEWGFYGTEADEILLQLLEQNYLNEERFAKAFSGGKFRVKSWGRLKIKRELKIRGISDFLIQEALNEIDSEIYLQTLKNLIQEKSASFKTKDTFEIKHKIYQYAASKGFEGDLIADCIKVNLGI